MLLSTMRKTGGFQGLLETIYGLAGTINAYDCFGHFTRAVIPTKCASTTPRSSSPAVRPVRPDQLEILPRERSTCCAPTHVPRRRDRQSQARSRGGADASAVEDRPA